MQSRGGMSEIVEIVELFCSIRRRRWIGSNGLDGLRIGSSHENKEQGGMGGRLNI